MSRQTATVLASANSAPRLELPSPTGPLTQMLSFVNSAERKPNVFKAVMSSSVTMSSRLMLATRNAAVKPMTNIAKISQFIAHRLPAGMAHAAVAQVAPYKLEAANEQHIQPQTPLPTPREQAHEYTSCWASNTQELRAAQALRWQVFADELGAQLASPVHGLDIDAFDAFCHHLLVKDAKGNVVGTYRALLPEQAELACGWYSSTEFYLKPLLPHAARVMEVGRSCVHPDHRNGTVMMMLWQELARFMDAHKLDWLFGCASVPTRADDGRMATRIWQHAVDKQMLDTEVFCKPKLPLDMDKHGHAPSQDELVIPPLLKGYMRLGAKIASAPALDEGFGCADFLIVLRKADITPRYAKHFFGPAAVAKA